MGAVAPDKRILLWGIIPFEVGDSTTNGTLAAITSGDFSIEPFTSLPFTFTIGNIQIISVDDIPTPCDTDICLPEKPIPPLEKDPLPPLVIQPYEVLTLEKYFTRQYNDYLEISEKPIKIKNLKESQETLREIEAATGVKPALIYAVFLPETVLSADRLNFSSQTEDLTDISTQPNAPLTNDWLELVLVPPEGNPIRKRIKDARRREVIQPTFISTLYVIKKITLVGGFSVRYS